MTAYSAFNSPRLNTNGYTYVGDNTLPPNAVPITTTEGLEISYAADRATIQWRGNAMLTFVVSSTTPAVLSVNRQYILNSVSSTLTLPPQGVAARGDMITIVCLSGPWTLSKSDGLTQRVAVGSQEVTTFGNISGAGNHECITLMCVDQQTFTETWASYNVTGVLTIT